MSSQPKSKMNKRKRANKQKVVILPKGKTVRVTGRGAYTFKDFGNAVKDNLLEGRPSEGNVNKAARYVGEKLGGLTGIPGVGRVVGNAGSWLARAFGFGAYTVKTNSLMSDPGIAQFSDNGSLTFSHREFVADIFSTTNFNCTSYPINPGNPALFPWLSSLAKNYEEYEFLGLIFEYKAMSANAVGTTNTGLGTVVMATDYDVIDQPYQSKVAMETADFSCSSSPDKNQIHPIECDPKQNVMKKMYIQNVTDIAEMPDDARFSVLGNFQLATTGMQAATNPNSIGELWVSYHVRLSKPTVAKTSNSAKPSMWAVIQAPPVGGVPKQVQNIQPDRENFTIACAQSSIAISPTTTLSLGTYLIAVQGATSNEVQGNTARYTASTPYPVAVNGATLHQWALGTADETAYGAIEATSAVLTENNVSPCNIWTNQGKYRNGHMELAIVNFSAVNAESPQAIVVPLPYTDYSTIYYNVYVMPYDTRVDPIVRPLSRSDILKKALSKIVGTHGLGKAEEAPQITETTSTPIIAETPPESPVLIPRKSKLPSFHPITKQ